MNNLDDCKMRRMVVQACYRLLVFVLLSAAVGFAGWLAFANRLGALAHVVSAIAFFVVLFLCLGWILYCLHRYMRKMVWRISSAGGI